MKYIVFRGSMKFKILSFLLIISASALANELCEDSSGLNGGAGGGSVEKIVKFVEGECPNKKKLKNICMIVGERMEDSAGKNKYLYTTRFLDAACVTPTDSDSVKSEKIRKTWEAYENDLKCNSTTFDVIDGSLLKFAVTRDFDDFLDDAIKWKVNLNKVDESDGRTLLDYLQFHIQRNNENSLAQKYKLYYFKLKKAGAKHKVEL